MSAISHADLVRIDARAEDVDATVAEAAECGDGPGPRLWLQELSACGALRAETEPGNPSVMVTAEAIDQLAQRCMTTAFSFWSQRMVVEYLPESGELGEIRAELLTGERSGATAMAMALQHLSGLRELSITARPDGAGGYLLDGVIPWASNLLPGGVVVLPARDVETGQALVGLVECDGPGVHRGTYRPLMALNATCSSSLKLEGAALPASRVISQDLPGFARRARAVLLTLQTAFCLGLARRCLAEAGSLLPRTHGVLDDEYEELAQQLSKYQSRAEAIRPDPVAVAPREVTQLRLDAAHLAGAASRLEMAAAGGMGYGATSGAARRMREIAFLPVQSPSEVHLRWDLR